MPFDVDASTLSASVAKIRHDYPNIEIHAVCGDFEKYLSEIPVKGRRLSCSGSTTSTAPSHAPNSRGTGRRDAIADSLLLGTDP
ncbi:L-histidine N(alpha)-methyltransferase [Mycobacterium kiyosense]|nr:hypothetical protein IWGMT90018_40890 [Mycobacterium kiyosense]